MTEPLSDTEQFLQKLSTLQENLEQNLPGYKDVLRTIHTALKQDEDLVHILTDEQIGLIVAGLQKHKGIVITKANVKDAGSSKRVKGASLSVDEI